MGSISKIWPEILLFTAAILISVAGLNRPAFHGDHELKVALPAHEAVAGGHWIVPYYKDNPRLKKPPLPCWAVAVSYLVTGKENEFTTRLPSAVLGILAIGIAYLFGRKVYGRKGGLVFAACLATTPFFMF
ncbi:MAG: hypothetical protein DRP79_07505, partial [Planctomycetota bacterium]